MVCRKKMIPSFEPCPKILGIHDVDMFCANFGTFLLTNTQHFCALYYGANCSCCGGNNTKQSEPVITHDVGMTPMHFVGASSSHKPW
jgi:hypothetical protein